MFEPKLKKKKVHLQWDIEEYHLLLHFDMTSHMISEEYKTDPAVGYSLNI